MRSFLPRVTFSYISASSEMTYWLPECRQVVIKSPWMALKLFQNILRKGDYKSIIIHRISLQVRQAAHWSGSKFHLPRV